MDPRKLGAAVVLLLGLAAPGWAGVQTNPQDVPNVNLGRSCLQKFRVLPYLTHVTSTSVRVNMVPEDSIDLRASISRGSDDAFGVNFSAGTEIVVQNAATADTRTHLVAAPNATFTNLTAGTEYKYEVECRADANSPYQVVNRSWFKTLQTNTSSTVRVGIMGDSHLLDQLADIRSSITTQGLRDVMDLSLKNIASWPLDFLIDMGDSAMPHALGMPNALSLVREDGTSISAGTQSSTTQTQVDTRWEIWLVAMQPVLQHLPLVEVTGNHEGITHWGGAGAVQICQQSQNLAGFALTGMQNLLGNQDDAYPNASNTTNWDGDTDGVGVENQNDGLYFEFASGAIRFFIVDNMKYGNDVCTGCAGGTQPARLFPGFVARTADQPTATFGGTPDATWAPPADSYEDQATLGATETGWFINRTNAKTETFGAVLSHRTTGGVHTFPVCYFYQRGFPWRAQTSTFDTDQDGDVSDEKYMVDRMVANNIQLRIHAHDHHHVICRKNGRTFIALGQVQCITGTDTCTSGSSWLTPTNGFLAGGQEMWASYDCDGDGAMDSDPGRLVEDGTVTDFLDPRLVQNKGTSGANGTMNRGFGILTVNGTTNMDWKWIVDDPHDPVRNNDPIITYGPIAP